MTSVYVFIFQRHVFLRLTQLLGTLLCTVEFLGTVISKFVVGFLVKLVKLVKFNLEFFRKRYWWPEFVPSDQSHCLCVGAHFGP